MKKKRGPLLVLAILGGACLVCAAAGLAAYGWVTSQPPTALDSSGYYVRGGRVYYSRGFPDGAALIAGADARTFVILNTVYAHDQRQVYFTGQSIPGADVASWELTSDGNVSHDKNHVYNGPTVVSDDPGHFHILGGPLSQDSQHIYWDFQIISNDPAHLVVIQLAGTYSYFRDSQTVFVQGNPIPGADPATFQVLQDDYARDRQHLYYFDQVIAGADPATFQVLAAPYARDAQVVYFMQRPIAGADPRTFQVLNLAFQCAADQKRAYYEDQVIANADPRAFPAGQKVTNCTASGIFFSP